MYLGWPGGMRGKYPQAGFNQMPIDAGREGRALCQQEMLMIVRARPMTRFRVDCIRGRRPKFIGN